MSQEQRVTIERRGDVLLIGLNRVAKRNAFQRCSVVSRRANVMPGVIDHT